MLQRSKFDVEVGLENFCPTIDAALERAATIKPYKK